MTTLRLYDFVSGFQTVSQPATSTPAVNKSAIVSVSFSGESTKSINTAASGINARNCIWSIRNTGDNYAEADIRADAAATGTLVLTASGNITATFQVNIWEPTAS